MELFETPLEDELLSISEIAERWETSVLDVLKTFEQSGNVLARLFNVRRQEYTVIDLVDDVVYELEEGSTEHPVLAYCPVSRDRLIEIRHKGKASIFEMTHFENVKNPGKVCDKRALCYRKEDGNRIIINVEDLCIPKAEIEFADKKRVAIDRNVNNKSAPNALYKLAGILILSQYSGRQYKINGKPNIKQIAQHINNTRESLGFEDSGLKDSTLRKLIKESLEHINNNLPM